MCFVEPRVKERQNRWSLSFKDYLITKKKIVYSSRFALSSFSFGPIVWGECQGRLVCNRLVLSEDFRRRSSGLEGESLDLVAHWL